MPDGLEATVTHGAAQDAFVVRVGGDIDYETASQLEEALDLAERVGSARTVVDLSGTAFADSSILHVLLEAQRAHRASGTLMVVCGPFSDIVRRLFDVTGTEGFFVLADSVQEALELPDTASER
ncbi:STAS domain-containing protein [Streptomyces sp. NPDC060011]|jgi:anti-anti-sigma factor|uniref:STAS domain-containing protein n=1 Tax=unclassified Streptomyces TaxID=2593676 RepID=UPI0013BAEC64|nr:MULTISPECIES: STAS domain-containing protein [unclassified Streptomyces]MCX4912452.1 STAS domain-containing protein [Streptomyces sp. NBC_00687]MCX5136927.1 STAS domain-containing protein [Streptomyces sp. NBC_00340]NEB28868.1 STAS domain-containing protein [Streptomyces sp. SID14446]WSD82582.1 STAS domain-containing protein [Streptomyces sp. NBC_01558]